MSKGRAVVVVVALILALATVWVSTYSRGVQTYTRELPASGGEMIAVVVSKVDIPAMTHLNELIKDGDFKRIQVPETAVVDGAVTSVHQLRDTWNDVAILAGEQIPVTRIVKRS